MIKLSQNYSTTEIRKIAEIPKKNDILSCATTTANTTQLDALPRVESVDKSHVQNKCPIEFSVRFWCLDQIRVRGGFVRKK